MKMKDKLKVTTKKNKKNKKEMNNMNIKVEKRIIKRKLNAWA